MPTVRCVLSSLKAFSTPFKQNSRWQMFKGTFTVQHRSEPGMLHWLKGVCISLSAVNCVDVRFTLVFCCFPLQLQPCIPSLISNDQKAYNIAMRGRSSWTSVCRGTLSSAYTRELFQSTVGTRLAQEHEALDQTCVFSAPKTCRSV